MQRKKLTNEERIIELLEKSLIANLYLTGASRKQIKVVVGVGTDKANQVIGTLKSLKKELENAQEENKQ